MKSALLTKAALCVCPPAIVATTIAAIPPVKRALHHATRPAPARLASAKKRPAVRQLTAASRPCAVAPLVDAAIPAFNLDDVAPNVVGVEPALPLAGSTGGFAGGPAFAVVPVTGGGAGAGGGGGSNPILVEPGNPEAPATPVPEPQVWLLMIAGFGVVGLGMRWRQRQRSGEPGWHAIGMFPAVTFGAPLILLGSGEAGSKAAAVAGKSAVSAALVKTALCVCPTAMLAAGAATVPAVKNAVHAVTAPTSAVYRPKTVPTLAAVPCVAFAADTTPTLQHPTAMHDVGRAREVASLGGGAASVVAMPDLRARLMSVQPLLSGSTAPLRLLQSSFSSSVWVGKPSEIALITKADLPS